MYNRESQAAMQAMSAAATEGISFIKETSLALFKILAGMIEKDRDDNSLAEWLKSGEDIESTLTDAHFVMVPYVNRVAFEKEMTAAGIEFIRNSDIDLGEIEQQMYIIDAKDKIPTFELEKKYGCLQPRHIITNEEQEKEYFRGCPVTDVEGFDKLSADRALRLLDEKGVLVSVSYDRSSQDYTLRVPRDKEGMLLEVIKEIEALKNEQDSKWIRASAAYRSLMNDYIKIAGDFPPDNPCIVFDAEKPNHYLVVSREGFEERYVTRNQYNELEEQYVYRNSLNNAITQKRYEELMAGSNPEDRIKAADFKPCYMKMPENREEFNLEIAKIADRMGTVAVIDKNEFDRLTEEQKMAPALITQRSLEAELILAQEGDRLKAYTIMRDDRGNISIELNTSIQHAETDINRDRIDRAVKSTEAEKILDPEEIGEMKYGYNNRIETNLIMRSTGFAAGVHKRDGQVIDLEFRNRNLDYRDINYSGSIQDELLKSEQKNKSAMTFDLSEGKLPSFDLPEMDSFTENTL